MELKLEGCSFNASANFSFNRTKMELKQQKEELSKLGEAETFNRTKMELKRLFFKDKQASRTFF